MQIVKNNSPVPYKPNFTNLALEFATNFVHNASPASKGLVLGGVIGSVTAII